MFVGLVLLASCQHRLCSPSRVSGSTSMPASIAPTWRATFLWGPGLPSGPYGSSASCMTSRLRLPLLLAGIRDAFFRSVSRSSCLLDLKTRVPKLARGTEACVLEDSGWWPSELCPSSLPADLSSEVSGGGPRLSHGANLILPGGGVLSSVSFLQ